jgi:hypothetical protein
MNHNQKLERFAEREIKRNIHSIILPDVDGSFIVFGAYHVVPSTNGYRVMTYCNEIGEFSNKKSAMSWCVADKNNQLNLAQQIKNLDRKKQSLLADINCRRGQANRSLDPNFAETVNTKIQPKISSLESVNRELEKCLISAKYLQIRGFNNET